MSPHLPPIRTAALAAAALALGAAAPAGAATTWRPRHLPTARLAAAPAAAVYGGHTSQDDPIALRVARGGRALRGLLARIDMTCDDGKDAMWSGAASFATAMPGSTPSEANVLAPARVARDGRIKAEGIAGASYGGGAAGTLHETLRGRLRRGAGSGTLEASLDLVDRASGNHLTSCRSGTMRWTTRSAPGRTYAGMTSKGEPVVVQRSRDGRKVTNFWISYTAPCQGGGAFSIGDPLVNFGVRRGSFGDTWSEQYDAPEGDGKRVFDYVLTGSLGATRASGGFRLRMTSNDAAGAEQDVCDTDSIGWAAQSTKGAAPRVSRRRAPSVQRVRP